MDADTAQARQLQDEEDAAASARALSTRSIRGSNEGQAQFMQQVAAYTGKAAAYEEELAQAMALSCLFDIDAMSHAAEEAADLSGELGEEPPLAQQDALALELLSWFKQDFFKWVDKPACDYCRCPDTRYVATQASAAEDEQHGASRTEVFGCPACGCHTRFPRYNDPVKLLETRRGRCGEWANCFALVCRAVGFNVRLVLDLTDHVWVEYHSAARQRWVHLDPCEAVADTPLLYEAGWGKRLTYCVAIGHTGVADVTRRYTQQWEQVVRRRHLSESWLAGFLRHTNDRLRRNLPEDERRLLRQQDAEDAAGMVDAAAATQQAGTPLPGRQTGSADWVAARGEGGPAPSSSSTSAPAGITPTRYKRARDEALREQSASRVCGGVVRASGGNPPSEGPERVADGYVSTKWLDFAGCKMDCSWLEYRLLPSAAPVRIARWALTSGNDAPERDPAHVVLEAWDAPSSAWTVLDERKGVVFASRGQRLEFHCGQGGPSDRFRLRVVRVANPGTANSVQLACWDLYESPPACV